ncbi:MAG: DUF1330 domain-containing protein [Rhizobiaceae bacterium]|nr:DUF1330 domain-containing protein [Rhizobiaceae bacterium]
MAAYILVDTQIENPEVYEEYKALARPIAESYGGKYLTRGGAMDIIDSDLWSPTRIVLIEFPDIEKARNFMNSEAYAPVRPLRENNAKCTLVLLEGL